MTILETVTSGFAEIKALLTSKLSLGEDLTKARTEISELKATVGRQEEELVAERKKNGEAFTHLQDAETEIKDLKAAATEKDATIATLKAEAKSVGETAAGLVAAQGLPAAQLPRTDSSSASTDDQVKALRASLKTASPTEKFKICQQIKQLLAK